jgi:hypothetical protein
MITAIRKALDTSFERTQTILLAQVRAAHLQECPEFESLPDTDLRDMCEKAMIEFLQDNGSTEDEAAQAVATDTSW